MRPGGLRLVGGEGLVDVVTGYLLALSQEVTEPDVPMLLERVRTGLVQRAASS